MFRKSFFLIVTLCIVLGPAGCGSGSDTYDPDVEDEDVNDDGWQSDVEGDMPDQPEGECLDHEECNGIDDDCDGEIDEDFDLENDVDNCGACNFPCDLPSAESICDGGQCYILECEEGYYDINGYPYDGCEYECTSTADSESTEDGTCDDGLDNDCDGRIDDEDPDCDDCVPEFCNGEDDDCDTLIDEDFDLRTDPLNCGSCGYYCLDRPNAEPICVLGECAIECEEGYADLNGEPEDGCEALCVPSDDPSESACDGVDDDCDGPVDEDYVPYTCGTGACETDSVCFRGSEECLPLEPESATDTLCDGIDNDCDGNVDEDFEPVSCIGVCVEGATCEGGTEICGSRLEDTDATCDGLDGDCDGEVDEDYVVYRCGAGVCENESSCDGGEEECNPLPPRSTEDLTCDDEDDDCDGLIDEEYNPYDCGTGQCLNQSICVNGEESCEPLDPPAPSDVICDGLDEDCDGDADEEYTPYTCGRGACERLSTCEDGFEDCNEGDPEPSDRTCNTIDEDCDGFTDEDYIPYQCGVGLCITPSTCVDGEEDCVPLDPPVDEDQVCDGQDEDCDGTADEDYRAFQCGLGVCERDSVCLGGEESCDEGPQTGDDRNCNGLDDNCNGFTDEGYEPFFCGDGPCRTQSTCIAGEENCTPGDGGPEVCDGVDNDCNGEIDDTFDCRTGMVRECTTSCDTTGTQMCSASCTWGPCIPPSEVCNGVDDDCDGGCDDGFPCCRGSSGECATTCGSTGTRQCSESCIWSSCAPPSEVCNGLDDDCDGGCDDGFDCCMGAADICVTTCGSVGTKTCTDTCVWGSCAPPDETCNGDDDDCDGVCDNGFSCCRGTTDSCTTTCGSTGTKTCSSACEWGWCAPPPETCNGVDDDCDGGCDDGFDCCMGDTESCVTSCGTVGTKTCSSSCTWGACEAPDEICNGVDDDCDGVCDNGFECCRGDGESCTTSCGSTGSRMCSSSCIWGSCVPPSEVCNGVDDDCDGLCDDGWECCQADTDSCTTTCGSTGTKTCSSFCGWGSCAPPAEVCNGTDDDCDGACDDGFTCCMGDTDSCVTSCGSTGTKTCDGSCSWSTCAEPSEICNGEDDDCDGVCDNGFACCQGETRSCDTSCGTSGTQTCSASCGWGACVPPSEVCNGIDDDCDGSCDDGWECCQSSSDSCDTSCGTTGTKTCSGLCSWGACIPPSEVCNGIDDDCDGGCDDTWECCQGAEDSCSTSCGSTGSKTCSGSCAWGSCVPPSEICNGEDDDCDGACDNGWACCQGDAQSCDTSCGSTGTETCTGSCAWGSCVPPAETCNGEDDDCDGACDNGWACCQGDTDTCDTSCGTTGSKTCSGLCAWSACDPPPEVCNGIDDDCDGGCDELWTCCAGDAQVCMTSCASWGNQVCTGSCAWGACIPPAEVCNGLDDDCNDGCDEDWECCQGDTDTCDTSCGTTGTKTCSGSCAWGACAPPVETCNGIDDDCNDGCDEDWECCQGDTQPCATSCGTTGTQTCNGSCSWGACVPPTETCNGIDDDCVGGCDDLWECCQGTSDTCITSCGSTGTHTCLGDCSWDTCIPPAEVCDGDDDDCDTIIDNGFDDAYEASGGDNCATAVNVGTVSDSGSGVININANILGPGDEDWFMVTATDDADTTVDEFNFEVYWTVNPGGLAFDVYRGDCSTMMCSSVIDCANWYTDFSSGGIGEDPCRTPEQAGFNTCDDDTKVYLIRVYRSSGSGYCADYSIRIRNNPTTPGPACAHL